MDRRLLTVAVVALVVLAGCGGGGGSSTPTADESTPTETPTESMSTPTDAMGTPTGSMGTPTDAMETPTPTPTDASTPTPTPTESGPSTPGGDLQPVSSMSSLPPGVTSQKVTNISAVFSGQNRALSEGGFSYDITVTNSSLDVENASQFNIRIANDTRSTLVELSVPNTDLGVDYYVSPEEAGLYNTTASETRLAYGSGPTGVRTTARFSAAIFRLFPQGYVSGLEWETAGVTTTGGEQRLVLTSDSQNTSAAGGGFFAPSLVGEEQTLQDVTARMEVTSDGVVRYGAVDATIQDANGETVTKGIEFSIGPLEADSVDAPDWLSQPPKPELSAAENDRLLVYEYTGQQSIPAGTNFTVARVSGLGGQPLGNVTFGQEIQQGDTVYVYKTDDGVSASLNTSVNQRPSLPSGATAFTGAVSVTVRFANFEIQTGVRVGSV